MSVDKSDSECADDSSDCSNKFWHRPNHDQSEATINDSSDSLGIINIYTFTFVSVQETVPFLFSSKNIIFSTYVQLFTPFLFYLLTTNSNIYICY